MDQVYWIRQRSELESRVGEWSGLPYVALDTEFERTNTYFAKPGLIQLADGEQVFLIDPLEVDDLSPFGPLLTDTSTCIVMHSLSEDVDLLRNVTGVAPDNVFDTQIAASLLGLGSSLGYQNLVNAVLGVELDKSETRSDWLKRPLSESQVSYAVKDAEYLCQLYEALKSRLQEKGLYQACLEETQAVVSQVMESWQQPENAYLKLRGAWDLSPEQQWQLRALVQWRDQTACTRNKPKPWIFSDAILIQIAARQPRRGKDLGRIKGVSHKAVHKYGEQVVELLASSLEEIETHPELLASLTLIEPPVKGDEMDTYRRLKKVVARVAEESGISAQLLGSRKMLEQLVVSVQRRQETQMPGVFLGWRSAYLLAPFKEVLNEKGVCID